MKKTFTLIALLLLCAGAMAQTVTLTFVGKDYNGYDKKLDSVVVSNRTKHWQETLYWPDTVLTIQNGVGVEDYVGGKDFAFSQNYPNPFDGTTFVNLQVAEPGDVTVQMTDITGRIVETRSIAALQPGVHQLRVSVSTAGVYFLTARQAGRSTSMKMVCHRGRGADAVAYSGMADNAFQLKNAPKGHITHPFNYSDQMEYRGYATFDGEAVESYPIIQSQNSSETISLKFSEVQDGVNCPEIPILRDVEGNVYQTVRIGKQCWMMSNLRTKHFADGTVIPSGGSSVSGSGTPVTSSTSPYYYEYEGWLMWWTQRGLLYNWTALMHGATPSDANPSGVQGVCPNGWHVPSEAEWDQLIDYVKSRPKYRCGGNEDNIAKALATGPFDADWNPSTSVCAVGNNTADNNATGFSVFPTGGYFDSGFCNLGYRAYIWSSSGANSYGSFFYMEYDIPDAYNYAGAGHADACVVRCLRDYYDYDPVGLHNSCPGTPTVTDYDGNVYPTVQIGQQCWMRHNLRTTHYADGTAIPTGTTQSNSAPYYYDYSTSNIPWQTRGYLYNWPAVMHGANSSTANPSGVQGICPTGWHIPSETEWDQLENYVSSQSQYYWDNNSTYIARALASTSFWEFSRVPYSIGSYPDANNATGFSAIPAGRHLNNNNCDSGSTAVFWSSTAVGTDNHAETRSLFSDSAIMSSTFSTTDYGFSVRCVRN